jgi:polysaccharide biosynthesis protein PslH
MLPVLYFDVVLLEAVFLSPYVSVIRKVAPHARVVLRAHNVEHEVWQRVAQTMHNPLKASYLRMMNNRLKRFEIAALQQFDAILAITQRDATAFESFGYKGKQVVAPVGLNSLDYNFDMVAMKKQVENPSISFIGSLDWMPNQEGIRWFLREVWQPFFQKEAINLEVAGINPPDWLLRMGSENVHIIGEVADAKVFLKQHAIMIAPLFSGGGIKVKVLEGMMLGRVVITTSTGLEGIDAEDGKQVLIANDAQSFYEKIQFCRENPEKMREIAQNAQQWVQQNFDRNRIAARVMAAFS